MARRCQEALVAAVHICSDISTDSRGCAHCTVLKSQAVARLQHLHSHCLCRLHCSCRQHDLSLGSCVQQPPANQECPWAAPTVLLQRTSLFAFSKAQPGLGFLYGAFQVIAAAGLSRADAALLLATSV